MRRSPFALSPFRPFALLALLACGPSTPGPAGAAPLTTSPAISAADLKARLSILADDSMMGREAGTQGDVKATDYIAAEAGRIGLKPAGENGGWFQTVPIVVREISSTTALEVDDTVYSPLTDFLPRDQGRGARPVNGATAIFGGVLGDSSRSLITAEQAAGKLVVVGATPGVNGGLTGTVNRSATTALFQTAAGIAVATLDAIGPGDQADLRRGTAALPAADSTPIPAFMYVTSRFAQSLLTEPVAQAQPGDVGKLVRGEVTFTETAPPFPARNVVAILPGKDPALKGEMAAVGAHNDHIGVTPVPFEHDSLRAFNRIMRREGVNETPGVPTAEQQQEITSILDSLRKLRPPRPDSISNGADDDGSGSAGVLELAEALVHDRPKRSVLFVWHTGEEKGLIGSDWFTRHPTVPRDSIVAQLNIDMIGRGDASDLKGGGPGYLQLIGSRRLSTELGDLIEQVNREGKHGFQFDYTYDAVGHPANYYCRSDHYMYARFGIPIAFFTTGAHEDYHQVTDEVQYIDFEKMARVVGLVEASTLAVANLDHPVVVDKPKPDPKAPCKQ
jgi:peptidase M28-like protein